MRADYRSHSEAGLTHTPSSQPTSNRPPGLRLVCDAAASDGSIIVLSIPTSRSTCRRALGHACRRSMRLREPQAPARLACESRRRRCRADRDRRRERRRRPRGCPRPARARAHRGPTSLPAADVSDARSFCTANESRHRGMSRSGRRLLVGECPGEGVDLRRAKALADRRIRAHEVESVKRARHDEQFARNTGGTKPVGVGRVLGGEQV